MGRRAFGIAGLLVLISCPSAWAGAPTERLRTFFDETNRVLTAPETNANPLEALGRVRRLVNDVFDFRGAAEQVLGPAWQARSHAERDEFTALFAELLQKNFISRVTTKARLDGGMNVRFLDEQIEGDTAIVRTAVETRDGHELRLDYRMIKRWVRGWKVRNVMLDGIDLLSNYQAQFARILHSGSYADLLAQMRAKAQPSPELVAQLAEPDEVAPSAAPAVATPPAPASPVIAPAPVVAAPPPPALPDPTPVPVVVAAAGAPSTPRASAPAPLPPPAEVVVEAAPAPATVVPAVPASAAPVVEATAAPVIVAPPVVIAPPAPIVAAPPAPAIAATAAPVVVAPPPAPAVAAPPARSRQVAVLAAKVPYWVQIGMFESAERAAKFAAAVRDPKLALETGPGTALRVLVGPFADRDAASAKARELRGRGYSTQIHEASAD